MKIDKDARKNVSKFEILCVSLNVVLFPFASF